MKPTTLVLDMTLALLPDAHDMLALCELDGIMLICVSGLNREYTRGSLRDAGVIRYFDNILYPELRTTDFASFVAMVCDPMVLVIDQPEHATYAYVQPKLHQTRRRLIHGLVPVGN